MAGEDSPGKNNWFPILDILGYLKNTHKKKKQIWKSETNPNLGTWLGITWLGFVSLYQILDFYPEISKNGNPLFFPVYI